MSANITDQQVIVAENQDYKIYLQGCYNAAGFGDSRVQVLCKAETANNNLWISKFGFEASAQFRVSSWVSPSINKGAVEAFLTQHAAAIEAAQVQFKQDFRSDWEKAEAVGETNLMNDNTEDREDRV